MAQLALFIKNIAVLEDKIEVLRQKVGDLEEFDVIDIFNLIKNNSGMGLSKQDFRTFFRYSKFSQESNKLLVTMIP